MATYVISPGGAQVVAPSGAAVVSPGGAALGVIEANIDILRIEYDGAGNYVPPRPNVPSIAADTITITAGRAVSLRGNYPAAGEAGAATQLQLFSRLDTGSYDFTNPDATATLAAGIRPGVKAATLNKTYSGDGLRWICLKAATADGTQGPQSAEVLIDPSETSVPAPEYASAKASRG